MTTTTTVCDHDHDGPHLLMWGVSWGGGDLPVIDTVRTVAGHTEADETAVDVFEQVAERVRGGMRTVECDDAEFREVARVIRSAAEYMETNRYADDESFEEDAFAARLMGPGGIGLLACWAPRV
jgi:hypothetical protein